MTAFILMAVVAAAPPAPALPDMPAPLGRLSQVLDLPEGGVPAGEKLVEVQLPGCEKKTPINTTRFAAGAMYALQQLGEWLNKTKGLEDSLVRKGALTEATVALSQSLASDVHACKPLPGTVTQAPKLCPGPGASEVWMAVKEKPAAVVRWASSSGADKCLPKVSAVLFDNKGQARLRYDADFGAAVSATLVGDKCQNVVFTFDAETQVFHAARRGCKG